VHPVIGIMSDSHDNVDAVKKAVRFFKSRACKLVIHAGDFVAPFTARELEHLPCPVKAVFGNCDGEKNGLREVIQTFGEVREAPFGFTFLGMKYLVTHIHTSVGRYASSGKYDVVIFGHTHKADIQRKNGALCINPGETGGWLSGRSSVAIFDSKTRDVGIVTL
jgi:putative phosphoesterase